MQTQFEKKKYPEEVLEIHREFQKSASQTLFDADEILNSIRNAEEKAVRLRILGFEQAQEAEQGKPSWSYPAETQIQLSKRVKYYQFTYPNYKFIKEEQVEAICIKYNLLCGEISRYKGFVPEHNLVAIEKFTIKDEDAGTDTVYINFGSYGYTERNKYPGYACLTEERKSKMRICAPITDMDMKGIKIDGGYKMSEMKPIPDPVVLQPVKGGYLIVTAWGNEASDEIIVNPLHN